MDQLKSLCFDTFLSAYAICTGVVIWMSAGFGLFMALGGAVLLYLRLRVAYLELKEKQAALKRQP